MLKKIKNFDDMVGERIIRSVTSSSYVRRNFTSIVRDPSKKTDATSLNQIILAAFPW